MKFWKSEKPNILDESVGQHVSPGFAGAFLSALCETRNSFEDQSLTSKIARWAPRLRLSTSIDNRERPREDFTRGTSFLRPGPASQRLRAIRGFFRGNPKSACGASLQLAYLIACLYCCSGQVEEAVTTARGKRWVALRDFRCVSVDRPRPRPSFYIYIWYIRMHTSMRDRHKFPRNWRIFNTTHTPTPTPAGMERGVLSTHVTLRGSFITTQKRNVAASFITMQRASYSFEAFH